MLPALTIHQLQVFAAVAREGGFRRAADALLLSEPAVSGHVKQLERAVGAPLFERSRGRRSVELTDAGRILLAAAGDALAALETGTAEIRALRPAGEQRVRLAVSSTFGSFFLPDVYEGFRCAAPELHLEIAIERRQAILEGLQRRAFDLGVVSEAVADPGIASTALFPFDVVLIGPPGHRLAGGAPVAFDQVAAEPIIASSVSSAPFRHLERLALQHRVALNVVLELADIDTLAHAVGSGLGIAAMTHHSIGRYVAAGHLAQLDVEGFPARLQAHLVHPRGALPFPASALRGYLLRFPWPTDRIRFPEFSGSRPPVG